MSTYNVQAPMHKNRHTTLERIAGFISKTDIFSDSNLWSELYGESTPFQSLQVWSLPGGSGAWKEWTFDEIIQQPFVPAAIGDRFGPTWTTHWFRVVLAVPVAWTGREVHLLWTTGSEATVWSADGEILQGISPSFREEYIVSKAWAGGTESVTLYIEMACNERMGMGFVPGHSSGIRPPPPDRYFTLTRAEIATFDRSLYKLYTDMEVLHGIASHAPPAEHIGTQALFAANEMVNLIKEGEVESAGRLADSFFSEGNGAKVHTLMAVGHCHIDSAWLWPYDESIRKVARSWSSQLGLLEDYATKGFTFAASSAAHFDWMKTWYPKLYERMKEAITGAGGQGRFIPVGGAWVELDGNIPSGEAFIRQFFYGQRFFEAEFGIVCKEFWLPDTFGYSAQIPQICRHVGIQRFMTQKLSWSLVNKFPNHNFWWEGIDGSRVLVHFPPGDSYNMNGTVQEMLYTKTNSEDKGRANVSLYLFGHGDGGGGPTRDMIERQLRCADVDGVPRVQFGTPEEFWSQLERESSKLYKWVGELYLELHNGTYTSQAKIKWYNRKGEIFLREVELLLAIGYVNGAVSETKLRADVAIVEANWKLLLLNQFHDVLPGTSIEMVTKDAWELYVRIFTALTNLRNEYHALNLGPQPGTVPYVYNALNWDYEMVIFQLPDNQPPPSGPNTQTVTLRADPFAESTEGRYRIPNTFSASLVHLNASGYTEYLALTPSNPVTYSEPEPGVTGELSNGLVRLQFQLTTAGQQDSLPSEALWFTGPSRTERVVYKERSTGPGVVLHPCPRRLPPPTVPGQLYLYDDVPLYWDAWDVMDYHLETRKLVPLLAQTNPVTLAEGPIVGGYRWTGTFAGPAGSTFERYTFLRANSPLVEYLLVVDWKESHKFLKVEWPVDILAREATYEIQYGHVQRPTHMNTSWDMAKFEVCGHKWVDISQGGVEKGVTFISDAKYGWRVRDNIVSLSLLRSPKSPDANCDMHTHYIHYAVLPHEGSFQEADVIRRAYELNYYGANNVPLLLGAQSPPTPPASRLVTVESPAIVVEAVKVAHDVPGSIVVRMYEAFGGNQEEVRIQLGFPLTVTVTGVNECDGLERVGTLVEHAGNGFTTNFTPFQLRSFIIAFQQA